MANTMTGEQLARPARARAASMALALPPWHRLALAGILLLAAGLNFFWLTREGYGNPYYAATVRSMLTGLRNFFFASYDPGGFVTVDKPPLGFWLQAASAWLFGFHGWSLLLPQALAGVLSVGLLYGLVARVFGVVAGLLAALALAIAPINVATNRNNTIDSLLVLALLLGAWAISRAVETGRLRWLLTAMALVGVGFNIKMLQAYLVLPAFALLYLVAAPVRWWRRLVHLALATVVLLAVSLSWALAVELTPPDQRPYVGGSQNNSVLDLAFHYNGLSRLLGLEGMRPAARPPAAATPDGGSQQPAAPPSSAQAGNCADGPAGAASSSAPCMVVAMGGPGGENGEPGPLRFFNSQLAGQVSWLLPLALLGVAPAAWRTRPRWRLGALASPRHQALLLWGAWLLTMLVFFSVAGFFHRYYLVMVSPAIAALAAAGVVAMWQDYRAHRWRGWLLPLALLGMAVAQAAILDSYPEWSRRLLPAIGGLCVAAAAGLALARAVGRYRALVGAQLVVAAVGVLALLIAPATWAVVTVRNAPGGMLPGAGPAQAGMIDGLRVMGGSGGPGGGPRGGGLDRADPKLVEYLLANRGDARFLVATQSAGDASPIILATGQPVMALGGFGADRILTVEQLAERVRRGEVRFFLTMGPEGPAPSPPPGQTGQSGAAAAGGQRVRGPGGGPGVPEDDLMGWVRQNCTPVPAELWQTPSAEPGDATRPVGGDGGMLGLGPGAGSLYDCGAVR